jgi:hypothetical protein
VEFVAVVHLGQHVHPELGGDGFEVSGLGVVQRGEDQQNAIGAHRPAFVDLPGVQNKILAEDG